MSMIASATATIATIPIFNCDQASERVLGMTTVPGVHDRNA
jgi:hypothetical protein